MYTSHINHQYQYIPIKISESMATATAMLEDAEREMKKLSWEIEQADELVQLHNNYSAIYNIYYRQSRYFDKEAKDLQRYKFIYIYICVCVCITNLYVHMKIPYIFLARK